MSGPTKATLSKDKKTLNQCLKNDFKIMVQEALDAMGRVLDQREKDLKDWTPDKQDEFHKIFGSRGEREIPVDLPLRGVSDIHNMTAREIMLDGIRRLRDIKGQLTVNDFINEIDGPKAFCARVSSGQQSNYKVHIGINFTGRLKNHGFRSCMSVMGEDSRVSTLCHEMSHFVKKFAEPSQGGMGTSDYDENCHKKKHEDGEDKSSFEQHKDGANKMVKKEDPNVFDNAYNIERYFQISA
ncbi:hypothetical protein OH773_18895 [Buttiauxella sp. WJP83]|uniref:hypothetical protein n=1 Tax=Buttiauxella sp. WJP83 TaxID=2986951 RepID=UPI0022DDBEFA|nr:hypothetical protein [Buttiauxella sp. WJP83]WBM70189.1 hypothetical protein OH773_18895 [Buttiauxella sp. WJP83]